MELFEQIRREYEFGVETIAGVAKKLGVHRRMVREAIASALPKPRKKAKRRRWKMDAAAAFVDTILEGDRKAPRKQRHAAHRSGDGFSRSCRIARSANARFVSTCKSGKSSWG